MTENLVIAAAEPIRRTAQSIAMSLSNIADFFFKRSAYESNQESICSESSDITRCHCFSAVGPSCEKISAKRRR
jgi:hypothetical protein